MSPIVTPGGGGGGSGSAVLFDSTLLADTASIDTGAAGIPQTQTLLEIWVYARTDEAAVHSSVNVTFNNDASAIYDRVFGQFANVTASANNSLAQAGHNFPVPGATQPAGLFGAVCILLPNYTGTVGQKAAFATTNSVGTAAANTLHVSYGLNYRSTAPVSRLKVANGGGTVLKTGSRLLILGR